MDFYGFAASLYFLKFKTLPNEPNYGATYHLDRTQTIDPISGEVVYGELCQCPVNHSNISKFKKLIVQNDCSEEFIDFVMSMMEY